MSKGTELPGVAVAAARVRLRMLQAPGSRLNPTLGPSPNEADLLDHLAGSEDRLEAGSGFSNPLNWAVHVYKSRHRLDVYFRGHLFRTYHAVFGRSLSGGGKLWEGDMRTPEGDYLIIGKHRSGRFGWFLHLNYPNRLDQQKFEKDLATRLIPASAREGGEIGIHGTDQPSLNVDDINWTTGCISVDNSAIRELARLLPVGTLVVINP